ncbi:MAG: amino acid permease [bacterium]|nr:amino acid permease [Deltaproteobacteria bacterium]MCP4903463.1 amino acid permease [bacterium]
MKGGIRTRSAAALVAANMIGAGVFTTSGFALADLGHREAVLLAWLIGGVIALCGALSYAGLASRIPGNGGEYLFLSRALHPLVGFLAGWVSLFAGFTAPIAVAAHGLEAYVSASIDVALPPGVLGAIAIVACGLAHGIERGAGLRIQEFAVAVKIVAILLFIVLGAGVMLASSGSPPLEAVGSDSASGAVSLSAFAVTLVWISFAYSGWNAAVYVAGELEAPNRTLPRALILATLGVMGVYVALNAVFLWSAPVAALSGKAEIGAIAAEALAGAWARSLLSGVVALGLVTSISAMVMVGPRVYAQMASDGLFPEGLVARHALPRRAIALQVGLALAAFFVAELRDLLLYVGFLLGLSAATTVACLFLPSIRSSASAPAIPGMPWVPGLFIVATLGAAGLTLLREPLQAGVGLATLAAGALFYRVQRLRGPAAET